MQLLILIIIAGVVGYWISKTRLKKPIDDTADKVVEVSRKSADKVEGWGRGMFRRKNNAGEQVIEGKAVDAAEAAPAAEATPAAAPVVEVVAEPEAAPSAEKQTSRRKVSETDTGTKTE